MATAEETRASAPYYITHKIKTNLRVHCGCGAGFTTVSEGEEHAVKAGHTLHITGDIRVQR